MVNKNYSALIISGYPSQQEIDEAWQRIAEQYSAAIGNTEYELYLTDYKEVLALSVDLSNAEILIDTLRKAFYQPLLDSLNKILGSSAKLDGLEKNAYYKQLDVLYKRSRGIKIKLDLKKMQLEAKEKKFSGKGGTPTFEYFDAMLITLSDHAGFQLTNKISVYEYCERVKRYSKHVESMNKKLQWQK